MKVLVVGSGGREHALAWHLARSGSTVHVAPGNGGTSSNVPIGATDLDGLARFAEQEGIDLTIVGPEAPLALGLVDHFAARGLKAFGPTRAAARLEWSKVWAKEFLLRHEIPTGRAEVLDSVSAARAAIVRYGLPLVLKADGLAGGKGVFVLTCADQIEGALAQLEALGSASHTILVEEYLEGPELSVLAFTDGERYATMPLARDYKRLLDGDRGPNTGGMGGYTWPSYATAELLQAIEERILRPTLDGMRAEGDAYCGVLYAGLMLTSTGPKVLEFNCRFGDPECQLILPLLETDLGEICEAVAEGKLHPETVAWRNAQTFGVVLAAGGYPEAPRTGDTIEGLDALPEGVMAFHAGTRKTPGGGVLTAGGRVLTIIARHRDAALRGAEAVSFAGKQFRSDIGVEQSRLVGVAAT